MSIIDKLLILQERDTNIKEMEQELKDIPARQELEQTRLIKHKEALAESNDQLKLTQAKLNDLQGEGESKQQHINKLRTQQLDIKTNKEFKAIESEVSTINTAIGKLEDSELEIMEEIEGAKAFVNEKEDDLKKEELAVQSSVQSLNERIARINEELVKVTELRGLAAEDVDPDWRRDYEQIFTRKDDALVKVEDGVCGGCHMTVPPAVIHASKAQLQIVKCDYCGRMLY